MNAMNALPVTRMAGVTLIEIIVALAIFGLLITMAMPSYTTWIQNTQIRAAAESMMNGMQLARAEAVRRNTRVQFHLVSTMDSGCALASNAANWVVSQTDPSGLCDRAPSDVDAPQIVQKKAGADGAPNATVAAANGAATITFDGLGRVIPNPDASPSITQIVIDSSALSATDSRDLNLTIGLGGDLRMCDPNLTADDPRAC